MSWRQDNKGQIPIDGIPIPIRSTTNPNTLPYTLLKQSNYVWMICIDMIAIDWFISAVDTVFRVLLRLLFVKDTTMTNYLIQSRHFIIITLHKYKGKPYSIG